MTAKVLSASTLRGDPVTDSNLVNLGYVEDLVLDSQTGAIAYVVLTFGDFSGAEDKFCAIPWNLLTINTERQCLVLGVEKEWLENAPTFGNDWPDMTDDDWRQVIESPSIAAAAATD